MTNVVFPFELQNGPGNAADASQVMANYNAIKTVIEGNLEAANLKDGAVTQAKRAAAVQATATSTTAVTGNRNSPFGAPFQLTLVGTGRPVLLIYQSRWQALTEATTLDATFWRDGTALATALLRLGPVYAGGVVPVAIHFLDIPSAGSHTYTVRPEGSTNPELGPPIPTITTVAGVSTHFAAIEL